jgi:hypothetical protein
LAHLCDVAVGAGDVAAVRAAVVDVWGIPVAGFVAGEAASGLVLALCGSSTQVMPLPW